MYKSCDQPKKLNLVHNEGVFHLHLLKITLSFLVIDFPGVGPH